MLEWHDCKSDPPKEDGDYLLITRFNEKYYWDKGALYKRCKLLGNRRI